jgi:15-cis-phytoene synthase
MDHNSLLDELLPERRLAVAYAPPKARAAFIAVLALDQRLARIVGTGREPIISQMRLAWWRERLTSPSSGWPQGEPVLASLAQSGVEGGPLVALVDGWETLLEEGPLKAASIDAFSEGRATAFAALADHLGAIDHRSTVQRFGRNWALADLASRLSDPFEIARVQDIAASQDWSGARIARAMRPLAVLHGLARRKKGWEPLLSNWRDGICAVRLGLFGR